MADSRLFGFIRISIGYNLIFSIEYTDYEGTINL